LRRFKDVQSRVQPRERGTLLLDLFFDGAHDGAHAGWLGVSDFEQTLETPLF